MATLVNPLQTGSMNPAYYQGVTTRTVQSRIDVDTDVVLDNDVWILAGPFSSNDRLLQIKTPHGMASHTAAIDNNFGWFVKNEDGTFTAVGADAVLDGVTFAATRAPNFNFLSLLAAYDYTETIGDQLSVNADTAHANGYYLGVTMVVKTTLAGDPKTWIDVVIQEATNK